MAEASRLPAGRPAPVGPGGLGAREQSVSIRSRADATVSGVLHVISFDAATVILETTLGFLRLQGDGLQIKQLDLAQGVFRIEGRIDALIYDERDARQGRRSGRRTQGGQGVLGSLFR